MMRSLECPHCGHLNKVDTRKFAEALCISCKAKFSDELFLGAYPTDDAIAAALELNNGVSRNEKVDVNAWTSKIGGTEQQEQYVKKGLLNKMKKHASKIPFAKEAVSMYYCAIDSKTPLTAKVTAIGALAYIVLPLDLVPDIILVVGYTDDAAAFWAAYKVISAHITDEHRQQAEAWFSK